LFRSKNYKEAAKSIDRATLYDAGDAFDLVVKGAKAKFDETVELHIKLGVDSRHADQQVRGAVVLPHGTGKTKRILVFCKDVRQQEALDAGADFVGAEDMIQRIQKENFFDYDVVVATPDMMKVVGRLGKILGTRGLMPNPKTGTVTMEIGKAVRELKKGKADFKIDKAGILHASLGKLSFDVQKIAENTKAFIEAVHKAKPQTAKGVYVKKVYLTSTMGQGLKISQDTLH